MTTKTSSQVLTWSMRGEMWICELWVCPQITHTWRILTYFSSYFGGFLAYLEAFGHILESFWPILKAFKPFWGHFRHNVSLSRGFGGPLGGSVAHFGTIQWTQGGWRPIFMIFGLFWRILDLFRVFQAHFWSFQGFWRSIKGGLWTILELSSGLGSPFWSFFDNMGNYDDLKDNTYTHNVWLR